MHTYWYDYVKLKYGENPKLYYMDTDGFIVHEKQIIFTKTLQKMLKRGLTLQILN